MQKRIPVNGVLGAQTAKQRIRVSEDLRIEQVVKAKRAPA
jgi:hypothetical protein